MTQFIEYQRPPQDPSYLGLSKEFSVNKPTDATASLVGDITKLGIGTLNAVDEMNKDTIDKQLLTGINQRRQEDIQTGMDVLASTGTTPPSTSEGSPNVPEGVNQGLRRAAHITQAKKMGKMADELYYGDMQQIAQNLTMKYPGYGRYIQDRMTHWLGTNAANAQRAAILNTLQTLHSQTNSEKNKWTTFIRQNAEWFYNEDGTHDTNTFNRAQAAFGNPQAMANIEAYISKQQSAAKRISVANSAFELKDKQNKATEADALSAYRTAATEVLGQTMTGQAFNIGGMSFSNWRDIEEQLDMLKQSGGKVDPENLALFGQAVSRYANKAEADMRRLANDPKFMKHIQDPSKLETIRKELLGSFANITAEVGAGNLRLATATINTFEGMSNNDALRGIRGNEYLRQWNMIRQSAGPAASIIIERQIATNQKLPTEVSEQLKTLHFLGIGGGAVPGMSGVVSDYNRAHGLTGSLTPAQQAERAAYLNSIMLFAKNVATNQEAPPALRENAARFIASGGTTEMLTKLPVEQQMTAWAGLASPDVSKSLKATLPPAQWRSYRTWAQETFKSLVATQADQITRGAQDAQGTNIQLVDGQLRFNNIRRSQDIARSRNAPPPISDSTIRAIDDINLGLQTYGEILKLDGKKLDEYELRALGINLTKPETRPSGGSGSGNKRTQGAPNGSEGHPSVSFALGFSQENPPNMGPSVAEFVRNPGERFTRVQNPNERVQSDFRTMRNAEDSNPGLYIHDDQGIGDQLRQGFPQPRR